MDDILVSVVIPVHNGAKYIKKCVNGILSQSLKQIEVILVENFSVDNSLHICKELSEKDSRVRVFQSFKKGTTFARKKGVQEAKGKYITFSDQDDSYASKTALQDMYDTIKADNTQICQFDRFKEDFKFIRKKRVVSDRIYSNSKLYEDQIKGVLGLPDSDFTQAVWDKIYASELIKSAVNDINETMFFSEDEYLNVLCFFNKKLRSVSTSSKCLYCWKSAVGFSSSKNSGLALLSDYDVLKPLVVKVLYDYKINENIVWDIHIETVYFCKSIINAMIYSKNDKNDIIDITSKILNSKAFMLAADYFKNYKGDKNIWEELNKLVNISDCNEWYDYCYSTLPKISMKQRVLKMLRRMR